MQRSVAGAAFFHYVELFLVSQISDEVAIIVERSLVHDAHSVRITNGDVGAALFNEVDKELRGQFSRVMQGCDPCFVQRNTVDPSFQYEIYILDHLIFGHKMRAWLPLVILVVVLQYDHGAAPEVLYEVLQDLVLAEVGTLVNKRQSVALHAADELMNLKVVEAVEIVNK